MSGMVGMQSVAARLLVSFYSLTFLVVAAASSEGITAYGPMLLAVVIVTVGAVALVRVPGDPLPLYPTLAMTAIGPVACALVLGVLPIPVSSPLQMWPLGAVTAIYAFMGVRGRTAFAWLGMVATITTCVVWSTLTGQGAAHGLAISVINLAPLLMATFFAFTIRPSALAVFRLREQTTRRIAAEAADTAVLEERDRQLSRLDELARPQLERIGSGDNLDEDERLACRLLEAHLRDLLRAPGLSDPAVDAAARAARGRGVEVILLDDKAMDHSSADTRARFLGSVAAELTSATDGAVTVRVLPPRRASMATILVSGADGVRRTEFDHAGRPAAVPVAGEVAASDPQA
ncbi:hypothetical protein FK531_09795 [Rhodococcus spelaei]|uniref:Uncharacterized protein n=1 Tax=Rhodococcus spelaei TaxID=2546320 RepID=A0A541BAX2_9NOCA|nr:hypothetical protein FK531_09795 [Rhodococcus spelaei]